MQYESAWSDRPAGRVLHFVGTVNDDVFRFLCPATHALGRSGVDQTVVMVDHLRYRHRLTSLHDTVDLVLSPALRTPLARWRELVQSFRGALAAEPPRLVHLHGLLSCLTGPFVVRSARVPASLLYLPHGPGLAGLWTATRPRLNLSHARAIAGIPSNATTLEPWPPMELLKGPVSAVFLEVPRKEAKHGLVVTGGRGQDARASEAFAQLAVLMGGEDLRISFHWIGPADAVSRLRLKAAGVGVFDPVDEKERASRLAAGWIYVAPGCERGFPLSLAEAMAAGLPCVAIDRPLHRDVIRHGSTGYLFSSRTELLECVAQLIDAPGLRARIGEAARDEAARRFSEVGFRDSLLAAYEMA